MGEQFQERWTICVSDDHRSAEDLERGICPDCGDPFVEVIPAAREHELSEALVGCRDSRERVQAENRALVEALKEIAERKSNWWASERAREALARYRERTGGEG